MPDLSDINSALPDYLIERELGKGGMGLVFLGRHTRLGRLVAIKELPPTFASDPSVRERFSTEARTLATLSHPHIVPIYDYVERDGLCLIVMEELPGGTVWDRFTSTGLTPPTACAVVIACCAALQHAHDKGVLHLDVKPDNLMFARDAAIKVTDFGISRVLSGDHTLGTLDGQVLGTPAYMSPEQARGTELTPRSDVYSAGVMLYELLCGHLPWAGAESATDLLLKRLREDPRPLSTLAPQVPATLADVVMHAIEREPEKRYGTAEDFGVAIATACAEAWGPDWLDAAGVSIIGSDRLSLAARTTRAQPPVAEPPTTGAAGVAPAATGTGPAPETTIGAVLGSENRAAPETTAVSASGASPVVSGPPPAPAPAVPTAPPEFQVVRAAGSAPRIEGANLNEIDRSAFHDVADALGHPLRAGRFFALAGLFVIAAVISAGMLFGSVTPNRGLKAGDVTVGGIDVASGHLALDLTHDLPIRVKNRGLASLSDNVQLKLSVAGAPVASVSAPLEHGAGVFKTGIAQYLATGSVTARIELRGRTTPVAHETLPASVSQNWYLTAFGIGSLMVILAGLAYLEGALRPLRGGRRRIASFISCALSAAVVSVGVAGIAAATGHADPTVGGLVVAAALAACAGVLFGVAVRRRALRKGVRRAVQRAETALGAAA